MLPVESCVHYDDGLITCMSTCVYSGPLDIKLVFLHHICCRK